MSERQIRIGVVAIDLFEAGCALIGALGLLVGFMSIPSSELSGTPFTDFVVPALVLGLVVGGSALVAALVTTFGSAHAGALATGIAGGMTVGFLTVEIALIGLGAWPQVIWLVVGMLMIGLAVLLWRAESDATGMTSHHQLA